MNFLQKFRGFVSSPSHSRTMGIVIILVLVSAISLTVIASQQQQNIKQRAAGNECALDYVICDSGYETRNNNCNQPIAPTSPNQADYQTYEEYGIAYDTYRTDYAQYQTDYSNCTESSRTEYETCKQNVYNVYSECLKNQSSAPAIAETPTPTAPSAETVTAPSQPTPTVPAVTATPTIPPTNTFVPITQPTAAPLPISPTVAQSATSCPDASLYNALIDVYQHEPSNYLSAVSEIRPKYKELIPYLIDGHAELLSFNLLKQAINNCPR